MARTALHLPSISFETGTELARWHVFQSLRLLVQNSIIMRLCQFEHRDLLADLIR